MLICLDRAESVESDFSQNKRRQNNSVRESTEPPGSVAQEDVKIKPSQQIPNSTFWNYVDAFFKPITEDDVQVLSPQVCLLLSGVVASYIEFYVG